MIYIWYDRFIQKRARNKAFQENDGQWVVAECEHQMVIKTRVTGAYTTLRFCSVQKYDSNVWYNPKARGILTLQSSCIDVSKI